MNKYTTAYIIFFMPKGVSAHPIAIYFDKSKAINHITEYGNEYTQLRTCAWNEGVLPLWSDTTPVEYEVKPKKKKNENKENNKENNKDKEAEVV